MSKHHKLILPNRTIRQPRQPVPRYTLVPTQDITVQEIALLLMSLRFQTNTIPEHWPDEMRRHFMITGTEKTALSEIDHAQKTIVAQKDGA